MEKSILSLFKILSFVLIAIGVVFIILVWYYGDSKIESNSSLQDNILTPTIWITAAALLLSLFLALVFPIIHMIQNPGNIVRTLIMLGIAALIGIISWSLASGKIEGDVLNKFFMEGAITESGVKRVSAALIATYFLAGITILATLYSAISSILKR
jgi:hypothetical protein